MNYRKALLLWGHIRQENDFFNLPLQVEPLKIVLTLFKNGFHLHPNAPKSVGVWGGGRAPSALASLPREKGANVHLRPGRQKPSVRHWVQASDPWCKRPTNGASLRPMVQAFDPWCKPSTPWCKPPTYMVQASDPWSKPPTLAWRDR